MWKDEALAGGFNFLYKRGGIHHTSRYTAILFWYQHLLHFNPSLKADLLKIARVSHFSKFVEMNGSVEKIAEELKEGFYINEDSKYLQKYIGRFPIKFPKFSHIGTLDPMVTGSLAVPYGPMTRVQEIVNTSKKFYRGTFVVGKKTSSGDGTSPTVQETEKRLPELSDLRRYIEGNIIGKIRLNPPLLSAVRVDGVPAYMKFRHNLRDRSQKSLAKFMEDNQIKKRESEIFEFEIDKISEKRYTFQIKCSKGTYIRSLIEHLCETHGSLGYLEELERTSKYLSMETPCLHFGARQILDTISIPIHCRPLSELASINHFKYRWEKQGLDSLLNDVDYEITIVLGQNDIFKLDVLDALMLSNSDTSFHNLTLDKLVNGERYTVYFENKITKNLDPIFTFVFNNSRYYMNHTIFRWC